MLDLTTKLLLLTDAMCCHLHTLLIDKADGVLLQRLVDSLLHLLSLSAGPQARLFPPRDEALARRMGVSAYLRPHVVLFPLAGALISLVLPHERLLPTREAGGSDGDCEVVENRRRAGDVSPVATAGGSARVIQAMVSSVRVG